MTRKLNLKEFLDDDNFDLSMNDLQDVPVKEIANYPKVTSLDLSNNKLTILSKSFATSLTHLVKLDLARNQLRELPKNFGCLINLKHLDLYKNKIETLPLSFSNLKSLKWLDMKDNPLEPHWNRIVGPCLNAQDCRAAAKNVVNVASMMNEQIIEEVQRTHAHQKEIEENELREQVKKKEKQKERKKRKNAAKQVNQNKIALANGSIPDREPVSVDNEEQNDLPDENYNEGNGEGIKLKTFLVIFLCAVLCSPIVLACSIFTLKYTNEEYYKTIMSHFEHSTTDFLPASLRVSLHLLTSRLITNYKLTIVNLIAGWNLFCNSLIKTYVFLSTDVRIDEYLNLIINYLLTFYVKVCEIVGLINK